MSQQLGAERSYQGTARTIVPAEVPVLEGAVGVWREREGVEDHRPTHDRSGKLGGYGEQPAKAGPFSRAVSPRKAVALLNHPRTTGRGRSAPSSLGGMTSL